MLDSIQLQYNPMIQNGNFLTHISHTPQCDMRFKTNLKTWKESLPEKKLLVKYSHSNNIADLVIFLHDF